MRALVAGIAALATALAAPADAHANPLDVFGLGSRETAMGGAVSADVSDFSANYYNPAGLALARGLEISVGYFRADHTLYMNGRRSGIDPVKGILGGAVVPGQIAGVPFAIGVGAHLPDDRLSRVESLPQDVPRWELYQNRNQGLWFGVNGAISILPWLHVGGGVTYMAATVATVDVSGHLDLLVPDESALRHAVNADLSLVAYPDFGIRIDATRAVALAVVYRGQYSQNLDVNGAVHAGLGVGNQGDLTTLALALRSQSIDTFLPQQLAWGASWKALEVLHANLDFVWVNWKAYVPPVTQVHAVLTVPAPQGGWPLGITPPTAPAPVTIQPMAMRDTIVPRVGAEWRALAGSSWEGFLRGGYEYAASPIAAQTGSTNYVDRDRHSFSAGLGVRAVGLTDVLPGDLRFDLHAQLSVLPTSTVTKTNPADLVGDTSAGGYIWNLGASATVGF
jgi:long-chain fatty acid transport protein